MVQGGDNAVLAEPDSLEAHFLDTLQGGGWINDQEANQVTVARLIVLGAHERRESRGAHWRRDFPALSPEPLFTVRARCRGGRLEFWREPVALARADPPTPAPAPTMVEIGD